MGRWTRSGFSNLSGQPLDGATLDVWQASGNGLYDTQDPEQPPFNLRGVFRTGPDGRFEFRTVRPASYPVPGDGPVGGLLRGSARHAWREAHIHAIVSAPGCRSVTTHIFDADNPYLNSDTVFGVKDSLTRPFRPADPGDPADVDYLAEMDFALAEAAAPGGPPWSWCLGGARDLGFNGNHDQGNVGLWVRAGPVGFMIMVVGWGSGLSCQIRPHCPERGGRVGGEHGQRPGIEPGE
jgi:Dioxygenase